MFLNGRSKGVFRYLNLGVEEVQKICTPVLHKAHRGLARIFPWGWRRGGKVIVFIEKCSLPVDRLGCTSECYIEVEQTGGWVPCPLPSGYGPGTRGFVCLMYSFFTF